VLIGSIALVGIGALLNNSNSQQKWPLYWFGSSKS
ncbi:HPP family protein, partial [Vibrio splendidus]